MGERIYAVHLSAMFFGGGGNAFRRACYAANCRDYPDFVPRSHPTVSAAITFEGCGIRYIRCLFKRWRIFIFSRPFESSRGIVEMDIVTAGYIRCRTRKGETELQLRVAPADIGHGNLMTFRDVRMYSQLAAGERNHTPILDVRQSNGNIVTGVNMDAQRGI